jgi:hypothetical protein
MGIMFQTFRPGRELDVKGVDLLQKWNSLSNKTRENIVKEVLGEGNKQPGPQVRDEFAKVITNASSDQT